MDVEKEHVHKVYSEIAAHFSDTRFKPWPRVAEFLASRPPGSLIADVGCGNGKYLGVNPQGFMVGSDICPELVAIGRDRGHEVMTCDCLHLPYRSNLFDCLICIAVIHHLSSEERRLKALAEMARVLRPGGSMLVYVWAMEQQKKKFDSQDVMVPWHLQPKYTPGAVVSSVSRANKEEKMARARAKKVEKRERKRREKEGRNDGLAPVYPGERDVQHRETGVEVCGPRTPQVRGEGQAMSEEQSTSPERRLGDLGYTTYQRYYHVFRQGELQQLLSKVPTLKLKEEYYDHENWCVITTKQI